MVTQVLKIKSLIHPDNVYSSVTEFWSEHNTLTPTAHSIVQEQQAQGLIIDVKSEIGADGKHLLQTKIFADQEAQDTCRAQLAANAAAVQEIRSTFEITVAQ